MRARFRGLISVALVAGLTSAVQPRGARANDEDTTRLEDELRAIESAFAQTMADRDLEAFTQFMSDEVVFFTGESKLRGPQAVADAWARYFEGEDAPFSWKPEAVAVLESGALGFTSGPVLDPEGTRIGTFNSVWRRSSNGEWRIVFDRGCP